MAKDLYSTLGIARGATQDEVKKAYRKLARRHHPDVNPGNKEAEERFKEISQAHDVLIDPAKRKLYDEFGADGLQAGFDADQARAYQQWSSRPGARDSSTSAGFGRFSNLDDIFGGMFGGAHSGSQAGADAEAPLEISLIDAVRGVSTQLNVEHPTPCAPCSGSGDDPAARVGCTECQGSGQVKAARGPVSMMRACPRCGGSGHTSTRRCATCNGAGERNERVQLNVRIPAGVDTGSRVRVAGKGAPGLRGGPPGDLYIVIRVRPHALLERRGDDLYIDVPITVGEAMRGASITVPTPDGQIKLKVAAASQSGKLMRLRGRGVPALRGGTRGDLYVRLQVRVPEAAEELDEAIGKIEAAYTNDVRKDLQL